MVNKYGEFTYKQFEEYLKFLHSKIHWLLIYNDPQTRVEYQYVNIVSYIDSLQKHLIGLNELLNYSPVIITIMADLEFLKQNVDRIDFSEFRKIVLNIHRLVDTIL